MTRRAKDLLAILIGLPAAYLALAGISWSWLEFWRHYGCHAIDFEWWHPALALFLGSGTGAAVLVFTPAKESCSSCEKLELKVSVKKVPPGGRFLFPPDDDWDGPTDQNGNVVPFSPDTPDDE